MLQLVLKVLAALRATSAPVPQALGDINVSAALAGMVYVQL